MKAETKAKVGKSIFALAGVTVRYLPYPRGGKQGSGYQGLRQVWCAADRPAAMTSAKQGQAGKGPVDCDDAGIVDQGYRLGEELGLVGTPTIYLPDRQLCGSGRAAAPPGFRIPVSGMR